MSIRMKIAAAAGALALIALVPAPAEAQTPDPAFAVEANRDIYNIVCRGGESSGTAPVRLRVTNDPDNSTPWVATWEGGDGEIVITREDRFFGASRGATFPCPPLASEPTQFEFTVTSESGEVVSKTIGFRRVGSASGPQAKGGPLGTTVLGTLFVAGDGPTPVGGIRTGAGGTSHGSNNLLVPLGAGLGVAGLAAAVMIRRRRCPAV